MPCLTLGGACVCHLPQRPGPARRTLHRAVIRGLRLSRGHDDGGPEFGWRSKIDGPQRAKSGLRAGAEREPCGIRPGELRRPCCGVKPAAAGSQLQAEQPSPPESPSVDCRWPYPLPRTPRETGTPNRPSKPLAVIFSGAVRTLASSVSKRIPSASGRRACA